MAVDGVAGISRSEDFTSIGVERAVQRLLLKAHRMLMRILPECEDSLLLNSDALHVEK